jgi:small subunit ribosomal protein S16
MAAVIRLKRLGMLKKAFYRIVVTDTRTPRDGKPKEEIGYYDPRTNPAKVKVDKERAQYWLGVGAQPSVTVRSLFKKQGIVQVKK